MAPTQLNWLWLALSDFIEFMAYYICLWSAAMTSWDWPSSDNPIAILAMTPGLSMTGMIVNYWLAMTVSSPSLTEVCLCLDLWITVRTATGCMLFAILWRLTLKCWINICKASMYKSFFADPAVNNLNLLFRGSRHYYVIRATKN